MFLYLPVKESFCLPEAGSYDSFGLAAFRVAEGRMDQAALVSDISTLEEKVAVLACHCTRLQLSPIHLRDVVEDAL